MAYRGFPHASRALNQRVIWRGWLISRTGRWNNSKLLELFVRLEKMVGVRFQKEGMVVHGAIGVAG